MVSIVFNHAGRDVLRLTVTYGQPVVILGDASWLDWNYQPNSVRLGRPVSFQEDAEEWARSLPHAYAGSAMTVRVVSDTQVVPHHPTPPTPQTAPQLESGSVAVMPTSTPDAQLLSGRLIAAFAATAVVILLVLTQVPGLLHTHAPASRPAPVAAVVTTPDYTPDLVQSSAPSPAPRSSATSTTADP
jgi:hypothetical protein